MANDGKILEQLVKAIEQLVLPETCVIKVNEKVFDQTGIQVAEFDIEIRGKVGTTDFKWLIECRDRPSEGPAPSGWIEQLVGRRSRFKFDKVIAVSTTGFAHGAIEYAKVEGIDLRTVHTITPESISDWFAPSNLSLIHRNGDLRSAKLFVAAQVDSEFRKALDEKISRTSSNDPILSSTETGKSISLLQAWENLISQKPEMFNGVEVNGDKKLIRVRAKFPNLKSRYQVITDKGPVDIDYIIFEAEMSIETKEVPISEIKQYAKVETAETISQTLTFKVDINDETINLDVHRLPQGDKALVVLQASPNKKIGVARIWNESPE